MDKEGSDSERPARIKSQPSKNHRLFDEGFRIYKNFSKNLAEEYKIIWNLEYFQQVHQITALQFWYQKGGPINQDEQILGKIVLKHLKNFRQRKKFNDGFRIYKNFSTNSTEEFKRILNLEQFQQVDQITALQYWYQKGGLINQDEQILGKLFLKHLKNLRQRKKLNRQKPRQQIKLTLTKQQPTRKVQLPGILKEITRLCKLGLGWCSQKESQQAKKKEKTVSIGQDRSISYTEEEEQIPLKQQ